MGWIFRVRERTEGRKLERTTRDTEIRKRLLTRPWRGVQKGADVISERSNFETQDRAVVGRSEGERAPAYFTGILSSPVFLSRQKKKYYV